MRSSENGAISADRILISTKTGLGVPTSASAADTEQGRLPRLAIRRLRLRTTGRDGIDEIGIDQQRRVLEHPGRDPGWSRRGQDHRAGPAR